MQAGFGCWQKQRTFCLTVLFIFNPIYSYDMLYILCQCDVEYAVAQSVEELRYKPEGHGFNSQWGHWNFSFT